MAERPVRGKTRPTANLRTAILEFRGLDSSIVLVLRGGIPRPMGNFLESSSQAILEGIILVGRFGVMSLGRSKTTLGNFLEILSQ